MDGVAVDDPDDDALEHRALGRRGPHRDGEEDEEGNEYAAGRGHVLTLSCALPWCQFLDTLSEDDDLPRR